MLAFGDSITEGSPAANASGTAWVPSLADALGVGFTNYGVSGATMLGGEELAPGVLRSSIRDQALRVPPPTRYEVCVTIVGTNDMSLYGTDADRLEAFANGLEAMLLHLTSRRRIPEPKNEYERRLLRAGKLPSVPDGATVWVGTTMRQSEWVANASEEAHAAYVAAIADVVAAVAQQGRPARLVDVASVYDPDTMGIDPPSNVHPNEAGNLAIKDAFYSAMQAAVA